MKKRLSLRISERRILKLRRVAELKDMTMTQVLETLIDGLEEPKIPKTNFVDSTKNQINLGASNLDKAKEK